MKALRLFIPIILTIIFCFLIGYLDFNIITPLLNFPNDTCYYHFHTAPNWVKFFYLDGSGHIDPSANLLHISLIFFSGMYFGILASNKILELIKKHTK